MNKTILLLFVLSLSFTSFSKAQLTISGEFRTRGEANHGLVTLPTEFSETAFFVSQRTRLNLKYNNEKFTAFFSLQDVRLWGQEDLVSKTGVNYSSIGTDISQAWFNWKFAKNWGLKTGRQFWSYDDGRILSGRNWNQTGLSWDAFLVHLDKDDFHFHFGSSINNTWTSFDKINFMTEGNLFEMPIGNRIKYYNFIWFNFQINHSLQLSINNHMSSYLAANTKSTIYSMITQGFYAEYKGEGILAKGEAYYQYGINGFGEDVSAYMASVSAKYSLGSIQLGAGFDYLSGDQDSKNYNAFDVMYGGRHKFNGWMNYYNLALNTKNSGLIDIYPNIQWMLNKKHQLSATYHVFNLEQDLSLPDGGDYSYLNKDIGGELDMNYTYNFDKSFHINAFFSYYWATETTEFIKNIPKGTSTSPFWFSVMLTYKPELFSTE